MSDTNTASELNPTQDDFAALLEQSFAEDNPIEGSVVEGRVTAIENDLVIIDVGLKTEGRVPLREFSMAGQEPTVGVGDRVEVFLERIENAMGEAMLSRDKARREESWIKLEQSFAAEERVEGVIFGRVKGGFTVDLDGATAFLPGSQVDIRPVRDVTPLMNTKQPFQILKMDRRRGNIVVSRRAIMEETRAEARSEIVQNLVEGQAVEGVVKNITDYGAFVELGSGIEGLVHVSEMSWVKKNVHPGKIVSTSQEVEVMVLEVDSEKRRISLGLKQCMANPWEDFATRYPVGTKVSGEIKNITEFGLFVGLEDEIDGMVHMSDLDWNLSGDDALAGFSKGQTVEAVVLDVDMDKERVSLGVKQLDGDPFESLGDLRRGSTVTCEVTAVTDGGLEVGVGDADVSAFIRRSDLSRDREDQRPERFNVGDKLDAMVTNIDQRARRIGLSIKALEIAEEKEAVEQYGSSDSGASLGDILGAALNRDDADDDNSDVKSDDSETEKD